MNVMSHLKHIPSDTSFSNFFEKMLLTLKAPEENKAKSANIQANSEVSEATIQINDNSGKQNYSNTLCFL